MRTLKSHWILLFMVLYVLLYLVDYGTRFLTDGAVDLSILLDVILVIAGLFGLTSAGLLYTGKVNSGSIWGNSVAGGTAIGVGLLAFGYSKLMQDIISFTFYMVLAALSLLFLVGLFIEYRNRSGPTIL